MLKIVVESGRYLLIREIDKVVEELGSFKTMKDAIDKKREIEES